MILQLSTYTVICVSVIKHCIVKLCALLFCCKTQCKINRRGLALLFKLCEIGTTDGFFSDVV